MPAVRTRESDDSSPAEGTTGRGFRVHPGAAVVWAVFLAALVVGWWYSPDEAAVREAFLRLGPLAPAAFVLLEFVQVVVIPIPGQPLEIPGGWFFGLVPGTVLGSAGAVAGSLAAFALARRYGQPWVEARVDPEVRRRFRERFGTGGRAEWIIFWLMLVPAFPRDPLCYLAGLTRLSFPRFALIAAIGRPVGMAPWVALGAEGVAVGLEVQVALAAVVGVLWLGQVAYGRLRRRASSETEADPAPTNEPKGERHA